MAINPGLLIQAPIFQSYLVDKDSGLPMSDGTVTMYQDSARTILKNWYYQVQNGTTYTYAALPNPLTLSAIGTIVDNFGNNVQPMYYPFSETDNITPQPYYVVVTNSNGEQQFTIGNFPFNVPENNVVQGAGSLVNYVANNVFWHNIGTLTATNVTSAIIAPSNHDGFSMPDIQFLKSTTGAVDSITFSQFPAGTFLNPSSVDPQNLDVTPEYYLDLACSGTGSETYKVVQFPISLHIKTLEQVPATITVWARSTSGAASLTVNYLQFLGTGVSPNGAVTISTLALTPTWQKFEIPFTFASAVGQTTGSGGDDAWYIQFGYPLASTFTIDIAKPSLYIGSNFEDNGCQVYDQVDTVISGPRVGDYRTSLNSFAPWGWVLCNDGVISNAGSFTLPTAVPSARANIDTWQLFNLIWGIGKIVDTGSNSNPVAQMYTSAGSATNYGMTAISDWVANKQLQLTYILGRGLVGLPPAAAITYTYNSAPSWNTGTNGYFTVSAGTTSLLYPGAPVYLSGTLPSGGPFSANTLYFAMPAIDGSSSTQFQLASSYNNAVLGTAIAAGGASNNGSGIVATFALGAAFGQSRHSQLFTELVSHNHGFNTTPSTANNGAAKDTFLGGQASVNQYGNAVLDAGGGNPFNIIQPIAYANVFLKL